MIPIGSPSLQVRLTGTLVAGLAFLSALLGPSPGLATEDVEGLVANASLTYDIHPEKPNVLVTWKVTLENSGPPPYAGPNDAPYYYDSLSIITLGDGSDLRAKGASGQALPVSFAGYGDGLSGEATVSFPHRLQYGDTFSFTLEYTVPEARNDYYLVGRSYVFLPAFLDITEVDTFRSASLHVSAPIGGWDVSIGGPTCIRSQQGPRSVYDCKVDDPYAFGASVEVVQPTARQTTDTNIPLGDRTVRLIVTNFKGDTAWGEHVRTLASSALPVLQQVMGYPSPRLDTLELIEGAQGELLGYAGLSGCVIYYCQIRMSPTSDDHVLLHELAHLWSKPFKSRWISEGLAEFAAQEAGIAMGLEPELPYYPPPGKPPYPLDDWGRPRGQLTATPEQRLQESMGYYWAARSFQRLKQTVDLDGLKATNTSLTTMAQDSVISRQYMDALEDATGANADDLFRDWIFPGEFAAQIADRRQARDRLVALRPRAESVGLTVPKDVQENIAAWKFGDALAALDRYEGGLTAYLEIRNQLDELRAAAKQAVLAYPVPFERATQTWDFVAVRGSLNDARAALAAYLSAKEALARPRSAWQRLGLWGRHPEAKLAAATLSFGAGNFGRSIEESQAVASMLEGASDVAFRRLLIGLGALAVIMVVGTIVARWALRQETSSAADESPPP